MAGPRPVSKGQELVIPNPKLKLLDRVREVRRVRHYAIRKMRQLPVRDGKGAKDRFAVLPESLVAPLQQHLGPVQRVKHDRSVNSSAAPSIFYEQAQLRRRSVLHVHRLEVMVASEPFYAAGPAVVHHGG